ncbi:hypothetical protein QF036_003362 [Arthrobacter globiformis]|nr:hypothetical protein [Arthrobacter globiformis]
MGGLLVASCLLVTGGAALGDEATDPGVVVTEPGPQEPQPEPAPVDPAPADPVPVPPEPIPLPVEPPPVPVEQVPAPVYPAPVPVQPVPVPAVPAPVVPVPVVPAPVPAVPVPAPAPVRVAPAPVISIPLRPSAPGAVSTPAPIQEPTALAQAIDAIEALSDQPGASPLENSRGAAASPMTARPTSGAVSPSAVATSPPLASKGLPGIAETQIQAAVAVATGSPFIVQLMTVLALVAAGVAYFRFMGARSLRTPSRSRK